MRKNKYDVNKQIAIYIISAQIASDAGKQIFELNIGHLTRCPKHFGYQIKSWYLVQAINLIRKNQTDFHYWISEIEGDQNGFPSLITYFDWKIDGKRYQASFHTPLNQVPPEMMGMAGSGRKTRWAKETSSRDTCLSLVNEYNLGGGTARERK